MRSSNVVVVLVALASALAPPAAAQATTLVRPGAGGTLAITDGVGGTGVNGVALRTGSVEPYRLFILKSAPDDFAEPDNLELAGTGLGCAATSTPLLIVCDSAQVRLIDATLSDHADSVDTSAVTRLGDQLPEPPDVTGPAAIEVSLGTDDDRFAGGPLREAVRDGLGSDLIATGSGSDTIVQSDSDDPGADDAGDELDPGAGTDVVSYAARRNDQGVTVTLDGNADDGAPGENDRVSPGGVVDVYGTPYADTLRGTNARDVLEGRDGADVIEGRAGDDLLIGHAGRDTITGGTGMDVVLADPLKTGHDDTIRMDDGEADGEVACGGGEDTVIADPVLLDDLLEPIGGFPLPLPIPIPIPPIANLGCEVVTRLVVDLTAPVLAWTATPAATTEATDARFAWTADGLGGGSAPVIETCRLDGGPVACSAQAAALTGLAVGAHTFGVHSVDLAGNASDAAYSWTITAPATAPPVDKAPETPAPGATPAPTDPGGATPAASRLVRPAGGRIVLERRNRITLRFSCAGNCPARALELRIKGAGRTYLLPVKVMTALLGESQTVRVTIPRRLAAAIRKAGRRGVKAALDSASGTVARLRLYAQG